MAKGGIVPYDSEVSKLQGEIAQLEKEIAAINLSITYLQVHSIITPKDDIVTLAGINNRLKHDLEYKEMKLSIHRQKTSESGVKY